MTRARGEGQIREHTAPGARGRPRIPGASRVPGRKEQTVTVPDTSSDTSPDVPGDISSGIPPGAGPATPAARGPGAGRARQAAIYRAGARGRRPAVPTSTAALERAARRRASRRAWAYLAGGAGEGRTIRRNRAAFERWAIVPRVLRGAAAVDTGTRLLGRHRPTPLVLAPIGAAATLRRDADLLAARAAASAGVPFVVSNQGCSPMEEVARAVAAASPPGARSPWWFQLYVADDDALVTSLLARAAAAGAEAVVVTLDTTVLGWRPADLDLGSLPFARGEGLAQYTSDPRFRELVAERVAAGAPGREAGPVTPAALRTLLALSRAHPGRLRDNLASPLPRAAVETFLEVYSNPGLSWQDLASVRARTDLPVLVKGVLHPDDARRALELGVDGIVVSNHGGRQVDNAVASLDALVAVREAVGPDPLLVLDSGVRTGADVAVALALGADAATLGRPWAWGLAAAGERGVAEVVANVLAELDLTMGLAGAADLAGLTREALRPAG